MPQYNEHPIVTIVLALFGAGGFGTVFFRWWVHHRRNKRANKAVDAFRKGYEAYMVLHHLLGHIGAFRGTIMMAHNSGGDITVQRPTYVTLLHEAIERGNVKTRISSLQDTWKRRPADEQYWKLFNELLENGIVLKQTDTLHLDSTLRDLYESQKVQSSVHVFLWTTGETFYFVSLEMKGSHPGLTPKDREMLRAARTRLMYLLKGPNHQSKGGSLPQLFTAERPDST